MTYYSLFIKDLSLSIVSTKLINDIQSNTVVKAICDCDTDSNLFNIKKKHAIMPTAENTRCNLKNFIVSVIASVDIFLEDLLFILLSIIKATRGREKNARIIILSTSSMVFINSNAYVLGEVPASLYSKALAKKQFPILSRIVKQLSYNYKKINKSKTRIKNIATAPKTIIGVVHTPYKHAFVNKALSKNLLPNQPQSATITPSRNKIMLFFISFLNSMPYYKPLSNLLQALSHICKSTLQFLSSFTDAYRQLKRKEEQEETPQPTTEDIKEALSIASEMIEGFEEKQTINQSINQ